MNFKFIGNRLSSPYVVIFIAVVLIYPALEQKIQVGLWHLWNGKSCRFQGYDVPVPDNWVAMQNTGGFVTLVDVGTKYPRNGFPSSIVIHSFGLKDMTLFSRHEQFLRSEGAQIFDRRTIEFDNDVERADCIVSNALIHIFSVPGDTVISMECESTAGLSIIFSGDKDNVDTVFSIVSQIRKHNE